MISGCHGQYSGSGGHVHEPARVGNWMRAWKTGVNTVYQDDGTTSCHDGSRVFILGLEAGGSAAGALMMHS